jgi:hypothetical protein
VGKAEPIHHGEVCIASDHGGAGGLEQGDQLAADAAAGAGDDGDFAF